MEIILNILILSITWHEIDWNKARLSWDIVRPRTWYLMFLLSRWPKNYFKSSELICVSESIYIQQQSDRAGCCEIDCQILPENCERPWERLSGNGLVSARGMEYRVPLVALWYLSVRRRNQNWLCSWLVFKNWLSMSCHFTSSLINETSYVLRFPIDYCRA